MHYISRVCSSLGVNFLDCRIGICLIVLPESFQSDFAKFYLYEQCMKTCMLANTLFCQSF